MEALERDGQAANREGRHEEALALFLRAHGACNGARALARAALTEAALGRWLDADRRLREALARAGDPWVAQNRAALEVEARRVDEHVGSLLVTGAGPAGEVLVDGRPAGPWPMREPVRVLAGAVTVTVRAPGFRAVERAVRVAPGVLAREEVALAPEAPVTAPTEVPAVPAAPPVVVRVEAPARSGPSALRVVAWTAAGLAIAGVAVGAAAWGVRATTLGALDAYGCDATPPDRARCDALADDADGARPWIIGGFVAGGALAVASALAFVFDPAPRGDRTAARWRCGPGALGDACAGTYGAPPLGYARGP
ncbi:MAG: hypothetical protein U0324_26265 [Polyangiales bacterium]